MGMAANPPERPGISRGDSARQWKDRRRYSWARDVALLLAAAVVVAGLAGSGSAFTDSVAARPGVVVSSGVPGLLSDASVAPDLRALADQTWETFLAAFRARTGCFGDVRLRATRILGSRAAYDPATATVTVRVPATVAMLQSALVHEWAHHIEYQCPAHQDLRSAFLAAQALPPDTPWRPDGVPGSIPQSEWARIPAEQYAEATIELVLGRRQIPTGVHVRIEAVEVIAQWAAGH